MTGIVNSTGAKSGIIGTTVGTPSGGKVRQVKWGALGTIATGDSDEYFPNLFQFDNAILSSSDVLLSATGTGKIITADVTNFIMLWFSSADGGSLGEGGSGYRFQSYLHYGSVVADMRYTWSGQYLVTNPNSTDPTYKVYVERVSGLSHEFQDGGTMTMMEIITS